MNQPYYQASTFTPVPQASQKPTIVPLEGKAKLLAFFIFIACILWVDFALFSGFNAGHTLAMCILTPLYFAMAGKGKFSFYSVCCIFLSLISTVLFAISEDTLLLTALFYLYFIMMSAAICDAYSIGRFSTASFRSLADTIVLIIAYPFMALGSALKALFGKTNGNKKKNKGILLGILCALPVIAIILPLLISADAAFAKMFRFLTEINMIRVFFAVLLGTVLFIFLYAHAYGVKTKVYAKSYTIPAPQHPLPTAALISFSCAISVVYVLYIVSQLTYFFSAFLGQTPTDFLPAAYARRGFFEMCIICMINLILLFGIILFSRREKGKISTPIAAISTFIAAFSLLLITTAESKMYLYINRFGLTRPRMIASVFMIFLAVVFIILILRLFLKKLPYMRIIILAAALISITLGIADIDRTIAAYNVTAYQNGKLSDIDVQELKSLDDSAIPEMIPLLEDKDEEVRKQTYIYLDAKRSTLKHKVIDKFDFRKFNFSRYRAYKVLSDNLDNLRP